MHEKIAPSSLFITLFSMATAALVSNLYYAQPLLTSIGPEIGIDLHVAGSIVSACKWGTGSDCSSSCPWRT